ncbi:uncharacterized protein ACNS7B_003149 isoform 1-T1 [Menidia menidia]
MQSEGQGERAPPSRSGHDSEGRKEVMKAVQVERTSPPMDEGKELLFQRSDGEHAAVLGLSGAVEFWQLCEGNPDNRRTTDIHGQEHYGASRSVLQAVLRESGPQLRAGGGGSRSGPCCQCCTRESPPTCR